MLIEFSVTNFRSIKGKQTLSCVTSKTEAEGRNVLETGYKAVPYVSEVMSIHGANGSGKTNLLRAMNFFKNFVGESSNNKQHGEKINVTPFLFSTETEDKPSEFEIVFIYQKFLFQYGFSIDHERIYEEWLYATPQDGEKQKPQRWFERNVDDIQSSFVKKELKGAKSQWLTSTRSNALFLSTATQLNSGDFSIPFEWIDRNLFISFNPRRDFSGYSSRAVLDGHSNKAKILRFMKNADSRIEDILVKEKEITEDHFEGVPDPLKKEMISQAQGMKYTETYMGHKKNDDTLHYLKVQDESEGTKMLFSLSAPILDTLKDGDTLIIDELHQSLHPRAMKALVDLFKSKKFNTHNAQLIFTTHDTNIMNSLGRDQICFVEKWKSGETALKPLLEFKGDRGEAIEKRYLSGRYGALPNIGDLL